MERPANSKPTASKANAFALTFAFASTHGQTQQKQKRVQATAPVHRRQPLQTRPTTLRTDRRAADNKGLKEIGGSVVNRNFMQLIKFGGRLTVLCSEIPNFFKPRNVRCKRSGRHNRQFVDRKSSFFSTEKHKLKYL
jgi:hypothetical protein